MSESDDNVIDFGESKRRRDEKARADAASDDERAGLLKSHSDPKRERCYHRFDMAVQVDTDAREVSCGKCGALLDPIEVLSWFARLNDDVAWARRTRKDLGEQTAAMEKRLKTVKAAIRREVEKAREAGLVEGTQATRSKRTQWIRTEENDRLAERIEAYEARSEQ